MTFIDPTTLAGIGVTDISQFINENPGVPVGSDPGPAPFTVRGAGGGPIDAQSGSAIITAFLEQYGLATGETIAYGQTLATLGLTGADLQSRLAADATDPTSTIGKAVDQKFPEIQLRRKAHPDQPMLSLNDVLKQRDQLTTTMKEAGLPPGFYDQASDFTDLIVSAGTEAANIAKARINQGYQRVAQADPTIRDAFTHYFGPSGDAALASYFLDPTKATDILTKQVAAAEVGGVGSQYGFALSSDRATELANRGATLDNSRAAFAKIQANKPLFDETISESTDLTAEGAGVDTAFNTGDTNPEVLRQRLATRQAAFSGGGGAFGSDAGQSGLGSARSR